MFPVGLTKGQGLDETSALFEFKVRVARVDSRCIATRRILNAVGGGLASRCRPRLAACLL